MSSYWRAAGLSYLQYSMITARALRSVLKEDLKVVAIKRNEQLLKVFKWKDGKQGDMKYIGNDEAVL